MNLGEGNTYWARCPKCGTDFPVSPEFLRDDSPECVCPACHEEFLAVGEVTLAK